MSPQNSNPLFRISDLGHAFALLTRVPVPGRLPPRQAARAAWAWPLVGLATGAAAGCAGWLLYSLGLSAPIAAGFSLVASVMLTGALHEDGLADSADGLWGGRDPQRRLEIMRDSRIGAYGVIALILALGLRWSVLSDLVSQGGAFIAIMAATGAASRAPMAVISLALPQARSDGLSAGVGRVPAPAAAVAVAIAALALTTTAGLAGIFALVIAGLGTSGLAALSNARLRGQTGDILGASQQIAEICILTSIALVSTFGVDHGGLSPTLRR